MAEGSRVLCLGPEHFKPESKVLEGQVPGQIIFNELKDDVYLVMAMADEVTLEGVVIKHRSREHDDLKNVMFGPLQERMPEKGER